MSESRKLRLMERARDRNEWRLQGGLALGSALALLLGYWADCLLDSASGKSQQETFFLADKNRDGWVDTGELFGFYEQRGVTGKQALAALTKSEKLQYLTQQLPPVAPDWTQELEATLGYRNTVLEALVSACADTDMSGSVDLQEAKGVYGMIGKQFVNPGALILKAEQPPRKEPKLAYRRFR